MFRRKSQAAAQDKVVDHELAAKALAKAVDDGDIVNFRLLFSSFSPARKSSTERLESAKYEYLLPEAEQEGSFEFREALEAVRAPETWKHILEQLDLARPAQLPSELVLRLGDSAVRAGKYTNASQAYELLRVRGRMQDEFFAAADAALDAGRLPEAVRGYLIASALDYDYAAFPEPLPKTPDFQTRALMLHGDYPERPEDRLPLRETESFVRTALDYLLLSQEAAARLDGRAPEVRLGFLKELVCRIDPDWREFVHRFREAHAAAQAFHERIARALSERVEGSATGLAAEIENTLDEDPSAMEATLLGRRIEDGEWWQYLKELASMHPPAVLFVTRQYIGDTEVILPLYREGCPLATALGISKGTP